MTDDEAAVGSCFARYEQLVQRIDAKIAVDTHRCNKVLILACLPLHKVRELVPDNKKFGRLAKDLGWRNYKILKTTQLISRAVWIGKHASNLLPIYKALKNFTPEGIQQECRERSKHESDFAWAKPRLKAPEEKRRNLASMMLGHVRGIIAIWNDPAVADDIKLFAWEDLKRHAPKVESVQAERPGSTPVVSTALAS
jgi:hypothetical protein